jgi:hypothetical protein
VRIEKKENDSVWECVPAPDFPFTPPGREIDYAFLIKTVKFIWRRL